MSPSELDAALAEARAAILAAPHPTGALARLCRHVRRERAFSASPASMPVDDIAAARCAGIAPALAASCRRVHVHD